MSRILCRDVSDTLKKCWCTAAESLKGKDPEIEVVKSLTGSQFTPYITCKTISSLPLSPSPQKISLSYISHPMLNPTPQAALTNLPLPLPLTI